MTERPKIDRRIKILHVLPDGRLSGVQQYVLDLCANLPRDLFRAEICFLRSGPLVRMAEQAGIHTASAGWNKPNDLRAAVRFAGYVQVGEFDIVHAHNTWRRTRLVAQRCGVRHVIHHLHVLPPADSIHYRRGGIPYWLKAATSFCDQCIVGSDFLRAELLARNPEGAKKVSLVLPGIDPRRWKPQLTTEEAKTTLGISLDRPVIGYAARMVQSKGFDLFIDLAAAVRKIRPDVLFLLCGDGPQRTELENKAAVADVGDSVRFLGWCRDLPNVMMAFDMFAAMSMTDVFPQSIFEPMVCGKPILGFSHSSMPNWIEDGVTGSLVKSGDIRELRDAALALIDNPERCRQMGEVARSTCRERFDISIPLGNMQSIYESLVSEDSKDSPSSLDS